METSSTANYEGSYIYFEIELIKVFFSFAIILYFQLLCELSNDEGRFHPEFRVWLLLPIDAVGSDTSVDCFKVAFDCIEPQVCQFK